MHDPLLIKMYLGPSTGRSTFFALIAFPSHCRSCSSLNIWLQRNRDRLFLTVEEPFSEAYRFEQAAHILPVFPHASRNM